MGSLRAAAVLVFFGALGAAWALSWRDTAQGRLYLGATVVEDSPAFRRALASAEKATPPGATLLGVVDGPDWNASHWSHWLYPRRVLWMSPEDARRRHRQLVDGLGIRYAIVVGRAALRFGSGEGPVVASGGGAELRALAP